MRWIGLWMLLTMPALAHDAQTPAHNIWMKDLHNGAGILCCSITDTNVVKDVQWDTYRDYEGFSHYKIFVEDQWLQVSDDKVVHEPNRVGVPLAWLFHANGVPEVRCFLPASGL
jgi:hypothetical protein